VPLYGFHRIIRTTGFKTAITPQHRPEHILIHAQQRPQNRFHSLASVSRIFTASATRCRHTDRACPFKDRRRRSMMSHGGNSLRRSRKASRTMRLRVFRSTAPGRFFLPTTSPRRGHSPVLRPTAISRQSAGRRRPCNSRAKTLLSLRRADFGRRRAETGGPRGRTTLLRPRGEHGLWRGGREAPCGPRQFSCGHESHGCVCA
jgi:hypothetical protein